MQDSSIDESKDSPDKGNSHQCIQAVEINAVHDDPFIIHTLFWHSIASQGAKKMNLIAMTHEIVGLHRSDFVYAAYS
jgi:hypothetical protein